MNVFEDLVVELKEENLLEHTVMDLPAHRLTGDPSQVVDPFAEKIESGQPDPAEPDQQAVEPATPAPVVESDAPELPPPFEHDQVDVDSGSTAPADDIDVSEQSQTPPVEAEFPDAVSMAATDAVELADIQLQGNDETIEDRKTDSDREFFKKRAVAEMSSLKMVEAVLSAVELQHLRIVPNAYDDLEAKKALHFFLRETDDVSGHDRKQAEYAILRQTELWCSALAARDKNITVANLRRYCETCRPMLSSQAMLALARFYRNLPYSETIRGKFDFLITRLFSRPMDDETRKLLFTREEMLGHVKTLYADWSSVPLYSAGDDESNILLTALSFEELSAEAESAPNFDDLIKSDFFGRLRLFKESIAELFFAPVVTAAAIECNIKIGNVYVKLIDRERKKMDSASIHQRFGDLDDQTVSEAVGRTLELVELLKERANAPIEDIEFEPEVNDIIESPESNREDIKKQPAKREDLNADGTFVGKLKESTFSINRWLLVFAIILVSASVGLYVWASFFADPNVSTAGVKTLSFQGTDLGDSVKTAKLAGETLYVVAQPNVEGWPKERQTELLQKLYQAGKEKGWLNVNLMNTEGRTIGFASSTRLDIATPQ